MIASQRQGTNGNRVIRTSEMPLATMLHHDNTTNEPRLQGVEDSGGGLAMTAAQQAWTSVQPAAARGPDQANALSLLPTPTVEERT
jgi:hypothetical protein